MKSQKEYDEINKLVFETKNFFLSLATIIYSSSNLELSLRKFYDLLTYNEMSLNFSLKVHLISIEKSSLIIQRFIKANITNVFSDTFN